MEMDVHVAVAKTRKYAVSESGDTVEVIERPWGGLSVLLSDGQSSGRGAKRVSNLAARKAMSLLAEGVRDGAAARAAHDYLRAHRQGKVLATLIIVSVDLATRSLVVSRNSRCPVLVADGQTTRLLDEPSEPIGVHPSIKPVITELPLEPGTLVVAFTDGVWMAGARYGDRMDVEEVVREVTAGEFSAAALADALLYRAVSLDQGRPSDDISVMALLVSDADEAGDVRRMTVTLPIR